MRLIYGNHGCHVTGANGDWIQPDAPVFSFAYAWLWYDPQGHGTTQYSVMGNGRIELSAAQQAEIEQFLNTVSPYTPPAPTLAETKTTRMGELAAHRYVQEVAGTTSTDLPGIPVRTDRVSQTPLNAIFLDSDSLGFTVVDWKNQDGSWATLNKTQVKAMYAAASTYIQACFKNEKTHSDGIVACSTAEAVVAYDISTGWPT